MKAVRFDEYGTAFITASGYRARCLTKNHQPAFPARYARCFPTLAG